MEITKRVLINELAEKLEKRQIQPNAVDEVVEAFISLIQEHIGHGDVFSIQGLPLYSREKHTYTSKDVCHHSSGRRSRDSYNRDEYHYSSNYLLNEFMLMLRDKRYLLKKTAYFCRNVLVVSLFVLGYYLIITLAGC